MQISSLPFTACEMETILPVFDSYFVPISKYEEFFSIPLIVSSLVLFWENMLAVGHSAYTGGGILTFS